MRSLRVDSTTATLALVVGLGVVILGVALSSWWQRRALAQEARERVLPVCVERLGEATCQQHLRDDHEDCARLTFIGSRARYARGPARQDQEAYQACILAGVNAWVAENGKKMEDAARDRKRAYEGR